MINEMNKMMEDELANITGGAGVAAQYHIVVKGDTLSEIAVHYGTTLKNLLALNPRITNPDLIYIGEVIRVF